MPQYTPEFKKEAIKRITEKGLPATQVAREIGASAETVRSWVKAAKKNKKEPFVGSGNLRKDDKALKELEKKVADLEEENAILKKAAAIFAKNQKP